MYRAKIAPIGAGRYLQAFVWSFPTIKSTIFQHDNPTARFTRLDALLSLRLLDSAQKGTFLTKPTFEFPRPPCKRDARW